ncbi:MAG: hypothetical protein RLY31_973 [Bacteroidota bacterium]|jgi:1,4-dihydroxy-6-naphthoate synthase
MKLTLGFSSCPNDTFLFDAMLHGKVDTEGLSFETFIEDVESLNKRAFRGDLDVTKLSYHAFAMVLQKYVLLDAGSALGHGCGPLLIARTHLDDRTLLEGPIAIPGRFTTANFLLSLAYPSARQKQEMIFSDIEQAVLEGSVAAGLIIHENRFTYAEKGLVKLMDLGAFWEESTGLPIPLGGIVIRRELSPALRRTFNRVLERSVRFALQHPLGAMSFVRQYAQEMDESVMNSHISLYVNDYSVNLGETGRSAVLRLFDVAMAKGVIPVTDQEIFMHYT